jgi:hypothetical protein
MWTATINNKGIDARGAYVLVDFTDGTQVVTERCNPQDLNGFKYWVKGRLATFNCKEDLDATYNNGDPALQVEVAPEPTAAEIAQREWFDNFRKMVEIGKLVGLGVFTGTETPIVNLRNKLKTDFNAAYISFM